MATNHFHLRKPLKKVIQGFNFLWFVGCSFGGCPTVATNGRSYAQCGITKMRPYQPRRKYDTRTALAKPLKPALRMSCCCVLPFFILSLSKYNQFSQSKNFRFLVRWRGTDGKALLQPLAFAGRLCGLQMCLGVKGRVRWLALTYLFFNLHMLKRIQI